MRRDEAEGRIDTTYAKAPRYGDARHTSAAERFLSDDTGMGVIAIKLESGLLKNPDADLRYVLPDLLIEQSGGVIEEDGYDYVGPSNAMVMFFRVSDLARATTCIVNLITSSRVLDNDLSRAATVAVQRGDTFDVIYPLGSQEEFEM